VNRCYFNYRRWGSVAGFTLIELLISLTILSLLITVLYQAFATATQVWTRQELFDETKARQIAVRRLLEDDFNQIVSYHYRHEKGEYSFFAGSSSVLFYATRNGFGARNRDQYGLFFVCCYLQSEEDGSKSLRIYKTAFPEKKLLTAFEEFLQKNRQDQGVWVVPVELNEESLKVIEGLSLATFHYEQTATFDPTDIDTDASLTDEPIKLVRKIPEILRFSYQFQDEWNHHIILPDPFPDPLEEKVDAGTKNDADAKKGSPGTSPKPAEDDHSER